MVVQHRPESSRRDFVKQAIVAGIALAATSSVTMSGSKVPPLLLNQLGFVPNGSKLLLQSLSQVSSFSIIQTGSNAVVWQGTMRKIRGDFGTFAIGDFSPLTSAGTYIAEANGATSQPFTIGPDAYASGVQNGVSYFSAQRCGDSATGYHAPCHIDDGRRLDNGAHQDVSGGWHDACDLRKWVDSTIYGMVGLTRLLGYAASNPISANILDELRWGNLYFRKMQEPAGYLMDYCGGDDGNYFTDNIIGTSDDRPIHTEASSLTSQFHFIAAQAMLVRYVQGIDASYAHGCLDAAERCLGWMINSATPSAASEFAAGTMACTQLCITTHNANYANLAAHYAHQLLALQGTTTSVRGFFFADRTLGEPYRDAEYGNLPLLALCDLLETFPNSASAPAWRSALSLHCRFLESMAGRSGMGIVPYGLYASGDPGGNRKVGDYWYRWFMEVTGSANTEDFWLGINANLASTGIGLSRAGSILRTPAYVSLAQRQLDWILGCNPFAASTVIGAGYNQPTLYRPGAFKPPTPLINGGVMNGIGGTAMDQPAIDSGSYHTCEYYTPMVAYTTWLMAELQASGSA